MLLTSKIIVEMLSRDKRQDHLLAVPAMENHKISVRLCMNHVHILQHHLGLFYESNCYSRHSSAITCFDSPTHLLDQWRNLFPSRSRLLLSSACFFRPLGARQRGLIPARWPAHAAPAA